LLIQTVYDRVLYHSNRQQCSLTRPLQSPETTHRDLRNLSFSRKLQTSENVYRNSPNYREEIVWWHRVFINLVLHISNSYKTEDENTT